MKTQQANPSTPDLVLVLVPVLARKVAEHLVNQVDKSAQKQLVWRPWHTQPKL